MTKVSIHFTDGEVISLEDVTAINTFYKKTSAIYTDDNIAKVPIRNALTYLFESATRKLSVSGEQIKYVEFTNQ